MIAAEVDTKPCDGFSGKPLDAESIDVEGLIVLLRVLFQTGRQKYITHRQNRGKA
jgi:hypothetical protein